MKSKSFATAADLAAAAADAMITFICSAESGPLALMLSGGRTPLAAYNLVAESGVRAQKQVHVFLSDERMVPTDSPESNYGALRPLMEALSIPEERAIRVPTSLPSEQAAEQYHLKLKEFLDRGGRIPLGFLGLGADGHTASLFSTEGIERSEGLYAIAVRRPKGPDRVSVTPDLLRRIERIVFLAAGEEKTEMVNRLLKRPEAIPAGLAVSGHSNVEVWFGK